MFHTTMYARVCVICLAMFLTRGALGAAQEHSNGKKVAVELHQHGGAGQKVMRREASHSIDSLLEAEEEDDVHIDPGMEKYKRMVKVGTQPGGYYTNCSGTGNTEGVEHDQGGNDRSERCKFLPNTDTDCKCSIRDWDYKNGPNPREEACCMSIINPGSDSPMCDPDCIPA
mmetsp:Transcript_157262/g.286325  ORF Transcript_157262/g.286325 Transcript_157262/m.286325 type:complete len:171 (-) Transcript_157262:45-557(-)